MALASSLIAAKAPPIPMGRAPTPTLRNSLAYLEAQPELTGNTSNKLRDNKRPPATYLDDFINLKYQ
jgi:hypothetical protein